jgi:membrane-bound lytic murein transglycosylase B
MKNVWALASPLALALTLAGVSASQHGDTSSYTASEVASSAPAATPLGFYWQLTTLQQVVPGTLLVSRGGAHHATRGTRSDHQFFEISSTGSNDVPQAALRAYHHAEKAMATEDPGCDISWTLLAAIGRVESNHGRFGGAQLGSDGVSRPEIRGPQLNGAGAFAAIKDSDHGALDHDKVWDRAVGQMQFLPQTWQAVARDGDGDGVKNPDDIDDSALGAAVYLCGAGGSLAEPSGVARAAFRYNHSDYYVQLVMSFQTGYQTGVFAVPSPPPPPATKVPRDRKQAVRPQHHRKSAHHTGAAAPKPATSSSASSAGSAKPAKPAPKPTPRPTPTAKPTPSATPSPSAPKLDRVNGTWQSCGGSFCLGGANLDLGPQSGWNDKATGDFDGNGSVETNAQEFTGLVGKQVSLQVQHSGGALVVYVIGNDGLRNADGSFARSLVAAAQSTTAP